MGIPLAVMPRVTLMRSHTVISGLLWAHRSTDHYPGCRQTSFLRIWRIWRKERRLTFRRHALLLGSLLLPLELLDTLRRCG